MGGNTVSMLIRKGVHALFAVFMAALAVLGDSYWVIGAGVLMLLAATISLLTHRFDHVRNAERASYGEFYFAFGVVVCAFLFLPHTPQAFVAGMLVLGFADTSASIIGRRFGRHIYHLFGEKRSVEGSLTVGTVSTVLLALAGIPFGYALCGGLVLAVVEAIAIRGSDNLLLPTVAGVLVVLFA